MIHTDGRPTIATRVVERCERCWEPECGGDCGFPMQPLDATAPLSRFCCGDPGDCDGCPE